MTFAQSKSLMSQIDRKSLAAFTVLIIFSFGMAWLVLSKADRAIEEFESMNNSRFSIIKKQLEETGAPGLIENGN